MIKFQGKIKNVDKFVDDVKQGNVWKYVQQEDKPKKMPKSLAGIVELVKSIHPDTLINKEAKEYLLNLYKKGATEEELEKLIHLGAANSRFRRRKKTIIMEDFEGEMPTRAIPDKNDLVLFGYMTDRQYNKYLEKQNQKKTYI
jgi:hypothetical protein